MKNDKKNFLAQERLELGTSGVQNKGSTTELPRTLTKGRTKFIVLTVITSKLNALEFCCFEMKKN